MRNIYLILISLLSVLCTAQKPLSEADKTVFEKVAQNYQTIYMEGSKNCGQILAAMNEDTKMWENGKTWTFSNLKKYCPFLPKKKVIESYHTQTLLKHDLGYDYVSQLYISQGGDTLRETVSRIWKRTDNVWKITEMNNLINKE